MVKKLTIGNFKSLVDVSVEFPRLAVLLGPNAAGKATCWTLSLRCPGLATCSGAMRGDGQFESLLLRGLIDE